MTPSTARPLAQTSGDGPNGDPIMIERRPFDRLGHANHGWLNARHHFSFADYYDPEREDWGRLRVWNDDEIAAGSGFPPHPHRDMEIITYVREGAITHQDSLGNKGRTEAGDVQVMSAGTGIVHSSTTWKPRPPGSSRSGSSRTAAATNRAGAPNRSRRPSATVVSSLSPAATSRTAKRCTSAPTPRSPR